MSLSEELPPPEAVAKKILEARSERALLRRLYRLVLDAKKSQASPLTIRKEDVDSSGGAE